MLILVRHPPVAPSYRGLCYGAADLPVPDAPDLAAALRAYAPERIISSDLQRCAALASAVAGEQNAPHFDPSWRERNFGAWEMQSWDAIHAQTGSIHRLMEADFAPEGGETLHAVYLRVQRALERLPTTRPILIVSHGGPIALARLILAGAPLERAADYIPSPSEIVTLSV